MKIEVYAEACKRTKNDLGPMLNAVHMALGLASELGELQECVVKDDLNLINLGEEIADHCWYICNYATDRNYILTSEVFKTPLIHTAYDHIMIDGGNIADYAKRWLAYGQSIDDNKKCKEEWTVISQYLSALNVIATINGLNIETLMMKNIAKLYKRYPDKFSEDKALTRDLEAELKVLS